VSDRNQTGSAIPGLTPMVKRIMIVTGTLWVLQLVSGPGLTDTLAVSAPGVFVHGYLWQPLTYMWLHSPQSPMHILINMFMLWMFGGMLERTWGGRRFLRFYLITGVGAGLLILLGAAVEGSEAQTLGASGAIYGIVTAFSLLWPDRTVMLLFPPIPMKAIWFIPILFFFGLFFGPSNVSHVGHLGGIVIAAILLRKEARRYFNLPNLRYRWHRYRMRGRLRAVRREEEEQRKRRDPPRFH
jgi:membrane associated rhomboid family serine protease